MTPGIMTTGPPFKNNLPRKRGQVKFNQRHQKLMSHTTSIKSTPIKSITALQAWVNEAKAAGINISLEQNAVPRMYYRDQIAKHIQSKEMKLPENERQGFQFHDNPEECDYVLRVHDAYYDIAFLRNKEGHLVPFFDDYNHGSRSVPGSMAGSGPIRNFLGANYAGKVEHWSGQREAGDQQLHSVGKMLQGYTRHAAQEAAVSAGYNVLGYEEDEKGVQHLKVEVS